jgi:hypothetical protein
MKKLDVLEGQKNPAGIHQLENCLSIFFMAAAAAIALLSKIPEIHTCALGGHGKCRTFRNDNALSNSSEGIILIALSI